MCKCHCVWLRGNSTCRGISVNVCAPLPAPSHAAMSQIQKEPLKFLSNSPEKLSNQLVANYHKDVTHLNRPFLVFYIFIGHTLAYFKLFSNCCLINCADGGNVFSQRQKREEKKCHCYRGRRVQKDNLVWGRCSFDRRERANKQRRNREENVSTLERGDGGNQQICLCVKEREGKEEGQTVIWFGAVNWQSAGECACIVNVLLGKGEDLDALPPQSASQNDFFLYFSSIRDIWGRFAAQLGKLGRLSTFISWDCDGK